MTEISAKSVSDVHGIIQNYEIENNSKFRVVKKDVNFGNDGKGKMFDQPWASRFPSGASRGILVESPGLVW
jgi:hypothetical protein